MIGGSVLPRDAPIRFLDETSETLIFYGLGNIGFGPKLHAVFPGGRIEEFIPSRSPTLDEWLNDLEPNEKFARTTARLHSTHHPISKKPWNLRSIVEGCLARWEEIRSEQLLSRLPSIEKSVNFDFKGELDFLESTLNKISSRVVFSSNDANRSNFLVKMNPDGSDIKPIQLVQIDYEFSCYNYRAFDIGNYFGMKTFDFGAEKLVTGKGYPSEEYRMNFVQAYVDEINRIGRPKDWDEDGKDSPQHIQMEADFGSFAVRLVNVAWTLRDLEIWIDLLEKKKNDLSDPDAQLGFESFPDYYFEGKKRFLSTYSDILDQL